MLLRRPHNLAGLFRDGRARAGWSQRDLAEKIGASRQWVSLVENGKVRVEFDLVMAALQALGYNIFVKPGSVVDQPWADDSRGLVPTHHAASKRTQLTRDGKALGKNRTGHGSRTRGKREVSRE